MQGQCKPNAESLLYADHAFILTLQSQLCILGIKNVLGNRSRFPHIHAYSHQSLTVCKIRRHLLTAIFASQQIVYHMLYVLYSIH